MPKVPACNGAAHRKGEDDANTIAKVLHAYHDANLPGGAESSARFPAQAVMAASTKDIWPSVCIFAERDATATHASAVHRTGLHPADVTWAPASMQGAWDQTTRQAEYEGQGYKVTFILDQWWDTAYNGRVRVQNTGGVPIDDWCLRLPLASEITNIWNADIQSHEDGSLIPGLPGWLIRRVEHWSAVNFEVPMSLSLYDCAATYKSIFHWAPTTPQWWVTGFNPDVPDVGVDDMLSVGSINFSNVEENQEDREAMYWALKKETQGDDEKGKLMIFDDSTKKAWLVWRGR